MANRLISVNENYDLPAPVTRKLAENMTTPSNPVGAALSGIIPRVLVHNGTAYPARPPSPAGLVTYKGPTEPTDWLVGDEWKVTS